jgi:hypothetical protein
MTESDHIVAAEGFLDLGMPQDAWDQLEEIEPSRRAGPDVLAMRLRILERMGYQDLGAEIARGATRTHPDHLELLLLGARHIRAADGVPAALALLLAREGRFKAKAAYWFDLACLHCQTGDLARTAECARRAVELDRSYQMEVLDHPDLEPLRASWSGTE